MSRAIISSGEHLIPGTDETDYVPTTLTCDEITANGVSIAKKIYCTPEGKLLLATYVVSQDRKIFELTEINRLETSI